MFFKKRKQIKKQIENDKTEQKQILHILLRRLSNEKGNYDVEAVWTISRLAHIFNCEDDILDRTEKQD